SVAHAATGGPAEGRPDGRLLLVALDAPLVRDAAHDPQPAAGGGPDRPCGRDRFGIRTPVADLDLDAAAAGLPVDPHGAVAERRGVAQRVGHELGGHDLGLADDLVTDVPGDE